MGAWQQALSRAAAQLRDMTVSQRIAVLFGGILVAGSLMWLVQWAARPELVPLLEQDLAPEDIALVRSGLDAMNERYDVRGARVFVRESANRAALLAQLQQQNQLPADTAIGFRALVEEANPWISREESNRRWTVALQNEIESVLRQFRGVRHARIFLELNNRETRFARRQVPPSASVTLIMRGDEAVSRSLARAAAQLVAGAVGGMSPRDVQVVDGNGTSALAWDEDDPDSSAGLHSQQRRHEHVIAEKIRSQLAFDPKVRVNVQVELDLTSQEVDSAVPSDPVETRVMTSSEETTRGQNAGQPGVEPNVAASISQPGPVERSVTDTSETEYQAGTTHQITRKPSGEIREILAAVNVSYSYLENVYRRTATPDAPPPSEADIQRIFDGEKAKIVNQVTVLVKPQKPEQVRVDWYYDDALTAEPTVAAAGLTGWLDLARTYGPQSALALLAVVSLTLLLRAARRGDRGEAFGMELGLPQEAIASARQSAAEQVEATRRAGRRTPTAEGAVAAAGGEGAVRAAFTHPVSQAAGSDGLLEAREVDQKTVQIGMMADQVAEMVEADEEAVTGLFEQWVQRKR